MSRTAAIGALALAAFLCVAAYFLLGRGGPAADPRPLLAFAPSRVESLIVRHPDRRTESAIREPGASGDWVVQVRRPGSDATEGWPANPTRVRAVLILLSTLVPIREAEPGTTLDAAAAEVEIGLGGGSLTFTLGSQAIGGRALMRLGRVGPEPVAGTGRTVWIDAGIAQSLVNTGLMPWRDRTLLTGFTRDVSRIRLTNPNGSIGLGRVSGRWGLREPVAAPADEETLQRLIATLAGLEIKSFFDDRPVPEAAAAQPPMATLVVESDQREPRGEGFVTRTRHWNVEFRQGGGLAAAELLTRVEYREEIAEPGKQPVIERTMLFNAITAADRLTDLAAAPDSYISRGTCQTPASDVGGLAIARPGGPGRVFARSVDGWDEERDGARVPCPPDESKMISGVVNWFCGAKAGVVTTRPPDDWTAGASVELRTLGGAPLVVVEVSPIPSGTGNAAVVVRVGPVCRAYSVEEAGASAAWLLGPP